MPFNIEPTDIVLIVLVALIIFGPSKLPEIGHGLGKAIAEFRTGIKGMSDGMREEMKPPENRMNTGLSSSTPAGQASPAKPAGGNYCTQCGAPNPPGVRFCNQCGEPF
jgi:TatA/E family protein of Tat protein translocase